MMQKPARPTGVTILAVLEILIGIVGLLVSIVIIGLAGLISVIPGLGSLLATFSLVIGGVALFFSLVWLATGIGLLHGRGWAWTLGMIFSVLSLLGSVAVLAAGLLTDAIVGIFFWTLLLYYLTRSHVKVFFGKGGLPASVAFSMTLPSGPGPRPSQPSITTNIPSYNQPPAPSSSSTMPMLQTVGSPSSASPTTDGSGNGSVTNPKALVSCPYCGARLTLGSPKCTTCGATV